LVLKREDYIRDLNRIAEFPAQQSQLGLSSPKNKKGDQANGLISLMLRAVISAVAVLPGGIRNLVLYPPELRGHTKNA
jgi:hypothetical protein